MDDVDQGRGERLALVLSSAAIAVVVALQAPGRIVPETKLDVTLDPVGYLSRAVSAWDPTGGFGRVQNQAIGYLFPMGAFSALGRLLGIPPWLVQRLWIALVITLAMWGAHRVARALGVSTASGRMIAAWAYALAPATLSIAAFQSAGQLPYALVPFVLVPLLAAGEGDSPRRVAGRSALWIAAMGGVNGASAFAVLPLVVVWFATRRPGPDRRKLAAWWAAGAVAATLWWLIPLLVSIRYGIRFTDYTETASLTTWTESGTEILRGTGNWLSFLQSPAGRWLPGGWALSASRVAIVGSVAVAAGGLFGLTRRDAPGRAWLLPSMVLGVMIMGIGYWGAWSGSFSGLAHQLLDSVLVPFRNVHKFSAMVRLPLALGLGHLVTVVVASRATAPVDADPAEPKRRHPVAYAGAVIATLAICLAILPAAAGNLTGPGSFEGVPVAWQDASTWLEEHDDGQRALLLPGSAFGEYLWGRPLDEPISSLHDGDWAVRDLIPLGGNGSTRVLDGVDAALQHSSLPPVFVSTLQRGGVGYLVVRNDLDLGRTGGPRPATVRRLLATAPELELVASCGAGQTETGAAFRLTWPPGETATEEFRAIDIYEVPDAVAHVAAYPASDAAVVSGGPEAMLDLEPSLTDGRAVVLSVDDGAADLPDPQLVATDTARRRDVRFGAIRENASYVLTADQASPLTGDEPVDRWPAGTPTGLTTARLEGAAALTDSRLPNQSARPEQQPWAAFDGNPATAWGPGKARVGEWVEVTLDEPQELGSVTITLPDATGKRIDSVRIITDSGSTIAELDDGTATVDLPDGPTDSVRIQIESITGSRPVGRMGISEIEIEGLSIERPVVVPSPSPDGAEVVSLTRDRLDPLHLTRHDEEAILDREFVWGGEDEVRLHGTATPIGNPDDLNPQPRGEEPEAIWTTATSTFGDLTAFGPSAAIDGDPLTAWVSKPQATQPAITVSWPTAVLVDTLQIDVLEGVVDPVHRVIVSVDGTDYERELSQTGEVSIPSTTTNTITISFPPDDSDTENARQVAVAEITIPALLGLTAPTPEPDAVIEFRCGSGPSVTVDGEEIDTRATATHADLATAGSVEWESCDPVPLEPGTHRLIAGTGTLQADTVLIEPAGGIAPPPPTRTVEATEWGRDDRTIEIGAGDDAIIATTENINDGWVATLDGTTLTPIRVDGWRQGWKVPAGEAGSIRLHYRPATTQRAGLVVGLIALLGLIIATAVPGRRARWAPPRERSFGTIPALVLVALAGLALGGPIVVLAIPLYLLPQRERRLPWVAAGAVIFAGLITFIWAGAEVGNSTGTFSGPAQALATIAVLAAAMAMVPTRSGEPDPAT